MQYKGKLEDFPKEVVHDMLYYQVMQGNFLDVSVFENNPSRDARQGGFDWDKTEEDKLFWDLVIVDHKFEVYFKKYPKNDQ